MEELGASEGQGMGQLSKMEWMYLIRTRLVVRQIFVGVLITVWVLGKYFGPPD